MCTSPLSSAVSAATSDRTLPCKQLKVLLVSNPCKNLDENRVADRPCSRKFCGATAVTRERVTRPITLANEPQCFQLLPLLLPSSSLFERRYRQKCCHLESERLLASRMSGVA